MSSIMSGVSNPMLWQQILSQSNNVSYSARGMYRVKDTDPGRKADYWFRDFGMVMACSYMTELSFRIVDKLYTIPHMTNLLHLNQLSKLQDPVSPNSKTLRYSNAQNYDRLPSVFQNRMMGTLIRSSSDLVPKIMREIEDEHLAKLAKEDDLRQPEHRLFEHAKALLNNPTDIKTNEKLDALLKEEGITTDALKEDFKRLANIDNRYERDRAIEKFCEKRPLSNINNLRDAITLEDARQHGILIDHIQRNQNYKEYVTQKFLTKDNNLHGIVPDFLKEYGEKVATAMETDREALSSELKKIWMLPPSNRVDVFNKKFNEFKQHFFVRKGQSFLSEDELKRFDEIGNTLRTALKSTENQPAQKHSFDAALDKLANFHKDFYAADEPADKAAKLKTLTDKLADHENIAQELHGRIQKKIEGAVDDMYKLIPGKDAEHELKDKLAKFNLHDLLPALHKQAETQEQRVQRDKVIQMGNQAKAQKFIDELAAMLPKRDSNGQKIGGVIDTVENRKKIATHIKGFMANLEQQTEDQLLKRKDQGKDFIAETKEAWTNRLLSPLLNKTAQGNLDHDFIKRLVYDAMDSKLTAEAIKKIQSSSTWPKTLLTVAFNFVFYGLAASKFDNKVLQPYEKKLVEERGTSQDIVNAGYLALIPGFAVLTQLFDKLTPLNSIRRMDSLLRFSTVGGAALATFAGSTYLILQQLLKTPPKNPPKKPALANNQPPAAFQLQLPAQFPGKPALVSQPSPFASPSLSRPVVSPFQMAPNCPMPGLAFPRFSGQAEPQAQRVLAGRR